MDRTQPCGGCNVGSIPTESISMNTLLIFKKYSFWIVALIAALSIVLTVVFQPFRTNFNVSFDISIESNQLFVATLKHTDLSGGWTSIVEATIFDAESGMIFKHKSFRVDDPVQSIRFDRVTGDILALTNGESDYNESCITKDGTCTTRIYKTNIDATTTVRLFESNASAYTWIVNSKDGSILIDLWDIDTESHVLEKVRIGDGAILFNRCCGSGADLRLSSDGAYAYQIQAPVGLNRPFQLTQIDTTSGTMRSQDLHLGDLENPAFVPDIMGISPNGRIAAFYDITPETLHTRHLPLYAYDFTRGILSEIPYQGDTDNVLLAWSGDSSKLLVRFDPTQLQYYDFAQRTFVPLPIQENTIDYVYAWAPSTTSIVYTSGPTNVSDGRTPVSLHIFNIPRHADMQLPVSATDTIEDVELF